jgi:phytol kinase
MLSYLNQDVIAFCISTAVMLVWMELVAFLAQARIIPLWQQRKILHIFTGPIYIMTWALFSHGMKGAIAAALVPAGMTLKFFLVGAGYFPDTKTIAISTRNNDRRELLKGPVFYGIIFILATLFYWKKVDGIIYLFILCFGDGMAEIMGRSFGQGNRLFWSPKKSLAGMIGFIGAGYIATLLFLQVYSGILFQDLPNQLQESQHVGRRILYTVIVGALIESLPIDDYDNFTVFLSAAIFDSIIAQY